MRKPRNPGVDAGLLIKDAAKLLPNPSRRLFLRNTASLGALALLTGCDIVDGPSSERALRRISEFNDWVQARLFNPEPPRRDLSGKRDQRGPSASTPTTTKRERRISMRTPTGSCSTA